MFNFHIYLDDVCIGDVQNVSSPDSALTVFALRSNTVLSGLTAVCIKPTEPIPDDWCRL